MIIKSPFGSCMECEVKGSNLLLTLDDHFPALTRG